MFRKFQDRRNVRKSVVRSIDPNKHLCVTGKAILKGFRRDKLRAIDLQEQLFDMLPEPAPRSYPTDWEYDSDNPYDFDPYFDCDCELCRRPFYPEDRDTTVEYNPDQNKRTEIAKMWAWYEENVA